LHSHIWLLQGEDEVDKFWQTYGFINPTPFDYTQTLAWVGMDFFCACIKSLIHETPEKKINFDFVLTLRWQNKTNGAKPDWIQCELMFV